jgi:hypothetical protein
MDFILEVPRRSQGLNGTYCRMIARLDHVIEAKQCVDRVICVVVQLASRCILVKSTMWFSLEGHNDINCRMTGARESVH